MDVFTIVYTESPFFSTIIISVTYILLIVYEINQIIMKLKDLLSTMIHLVFQVQPLAVETYPPRAYDLQLAAVLLLHPQGELSTH